MSKNEIKVIKSSKSINSFSKNLSSKNFSNHLYMSSNKYASSSSNNLLETIGDISKCRTNSSNYKKNRKKKEKNEFYKKRRSRDISKLLKYKERIKIPTGKRYSNANFKSNLNMNNINKIYKKEQEKKIRRDKNGVEINKINKKQVHITFLDKISPNNKITEIIHIQSYKKLYMLENMNKEGTKNKCNICCVIF